MIYLTIALAVASGALGAYLFWLFKARKLYGKWTPKWSSTGVLPDAIYVVRQVEPAGFTKVLYEGDDLQAAKLAFKTVKMPKPTVVEFYTHGSHTASRSI